MVQKESISDLYEECHRRFIYKEGKLYFRYTIHSKQKEGETITRKSGGYLTTTINYKGYLVHRLIFLMHHKYLPSMIDHIDRDKLNNKIENLRPADKELNSWNRGLQSNNTSGFRGISWNKNANKWHAYIKIKGKRKHLGLFNTIEEAKEVYDRNAPNI